MIRYHHRHANRMLVAGIVLLGMNLLVLTSAGTLTALPSGLLVLAIGILFKSVPLVTVDGEKITIRKAPLRSASLHSLREVHSVGPIDEHGICVQTATQSFTVPVTALSDDDRQHVFRFLSDLALPPRPVSLRTESTPAVW